ncbi:hypothetical protein ACH495_10705 [Micromonospora sp. NPDC018662]|uniref:hypothetical protein n=1 Tax=Micromonospora sp. NPDC018662 TaxID=3364238 RepID=UPI0037BC7D73
MHEDTRTIGYAEARPVAPDGVVTIEIRIDGRGGLAHPSAVVAEVVRGLSVEYDGQCRRRDEVIERAAASWLLGREPHSDVGVVPGMVSEDPEINAEAVALWQGLRDLPDGEALARVTAVRTALRACQDPTGMLSESAR